MIRASADFRTDLIYVVLARLSLSGKEGMIVVYETVDA